MLKTAIAAYYESIDQHRLLDLLAVHVTDRGVRNLLWQAMCHTVTWGGLYRDCERGISRGCPLSPLLGAVFLGALDAAMEKLGFFYVRFMDDVLVLTRTRWQLRKAVRVLNAVLFDLDLSKAHNKTFIGRIEKGFDFLVYHFSRTGLTVAGQTIDKFVARSTRLYEQGLARPDGHDRLENYVRRWLRGVAAGIAPSSTRPSPAPF